MGKTVNLFSTDFTKTAPSASNLILTRPLDSFHVSILKQLFEKNHQNTQWRGYAVLDYIPGFLKRNIMSSPTEKQVGIVLFCSQTEQTYFVFRDLQENFRLVDTNGHTLVMEEQIETLVEQFQAKILH